MDSSAEAQGIYGVRVTGLGPCATMGAVPAEWPAWHVVAGSAEGSIEPAPEFVSDDAAHIRFEDGSIADLTRLEHGARVEVRLARPMPDVPDLVHPYLSVVGMVGAYWGGRIPFHAGAVGIDGRAWLVAAEKGGGKSTTLALLARSGHPVLADDLSVVDGDLSVHRGPRFIDLRGEVAEALGVGRYLGVLGVRERWRYDIGEAPLTMPLAGLIIPGWGNAAVEPVRGSERMMLLAPSLSLRVPGPWNELFMDVALTLPVFRWSRPHGLESADYTIEQLLTRLRAAAA